MTSKEEKEWSLRWALLFSHSAISVIYSQDVTFREELQELQE